MGTITGFDVNTAVDRLVDRAVKSGMNRTLADMHAYARGVTPVDTGQLRDAWAVHPAERAGLHVRGSLYNDTPYGVYVEFGTSRMAGRHMAAQAIDAEGVNLARNIESRL